MNLSILWMTAMAELAHMPSTGDPAGMCRRMHRGREVQEVD
jgi:hypothetical protein